MISDRITKYIVKTANAMEEAGNKIDWRHIRGKVFSQWHEDYPEYMLEKLYWHEAGNPKWKQDKPQADFVDLRNTVESMREEMDRKLGDKS